MKIAVFGAGYVGLVAGTCFADSGHEVVLVDVDAKRVADLREGKIPIYEPGLEELVKRNVAEERLSFSTEAGTAVRNADVVFIAVGTPPDAEGHADLKYVLSVARTIGENLNGYKVVVDKSTVPVGTADKVRAQIQASAPKGAQFDVVSNPEFLKEGAAIDDFMKPDRVVIGADTDRAKTIMGDLYAPFVRTNNPILFMDVRSAELTKYAANAMLAARISFMNEIARLCELLGANVESVRKGIGTDSRIGFPFLFPGPGYGGSCFPKDVQALIQTAAAAGYELKLGRAIEDVNSAQKHLLADKVVKRFGQDLKGMTFCVWGLAFKPNTDDVREAPALVVIEDLLARGAKIQATDPEAIETTRKVLGDRIKYFEKNFDALPGSDALILVTEWNEYRRPNFAHIKEKLRKPVIFDGRNVYDRKALEALGFEYFGIGV
jgi:UDPglucose 6-dehydrogenase